MPKLPSGTDDLALLLAARSGDHDAGARLVGRHADPMVRTAWNVLGRFGGADAEDVVQEAFIAALTTDALPRGEVGPWLRAITARKALDALRLVSRRAERPLDAWDPAVSAADAPFAVLVVRRALARLSPLDRAVLTLVDLGGLSMGEAARAVGSTAAAVKWRAVRARRRLRRAIEAGASEAQGGSDDAAE